MGTKVLVTGATGQLGPYVVEELLGRGHQCVAWSRRRRVQLGKGVTSVAVPLEDAREVEAAWHRATPAVVVHMAAMSRIDECHRDPVRARSVNVGATDHLVRLARNDGLPFLYISTDLVFDGEKGQYTEDDPPNPTSVYGRTKWEAEQVVLSYDLGTVFRLALLYGPGKHGVKTFLDRTIEAWRAGQSVPLFEDEWRSPLALPDAADAVAQWAEMLIPGLFHVGGPERLSRYEMGCRVADALGFPRTLCRRASRSDWSGPEPRPRDVSLDSTRWRKACPTWSPRPLEINVRRMWPPAPATTDL